MISFLFTHGVESATMANYLQPSKETGGSDMNSRERVVSLGIDIGKNSFHLWGVNEQDERV